MLIEAMAKDLRLPSAYIESVIGSASHAYKTYQVPKRTKGFRTIHHPSRPLKALQRWMLTNIISKFPVHSAAMAYQKGCSILKNAAAHSDSQYLLRMDFENFFPSIKEAHIHAYLQVAKTQTPELFGWTSDDENVFLRIVLRKSALTIGAPTSPGLSNAICYELDSRISTLCNARRVSYTRYADDLFFSTKLRGVLKSIETEVESLVAGLALPDGLSINKAKTRHYSKKNSRRVTGIVLGSDSKAYVGRDLKRKVRAMIHKYATLDPSERASLSGLISYVMGFDPDFINSLIKKYNLPAVQQARLK